MNAFEEHMTQHQIRWRKTNVHATDWGWQNGRQYEHILPARDWEEGLWPGIRKGSTNSLQAYLSNGIQKHPGAHNLKSSWTLCANLYFTFRQILGLPLLTGFLQQHVSAAIQRVDSVELEYAECCPLDPQTLLGEPSEGTRGANQTSPDVAFLVTTASGRGLILTENKFVEHSFYRCPGRQVRDTARRLGNPIPFRCYDVSAVLADPAAQCHLASGDVPRKYWQRIGPVADRSQFSRLSSCPAARAGYQLFRQQALAEGIAASGKYDFVATCLAIDQRNTVLDRCLRSTGVRSIRDWGSLFNGKASFAVFTHQEWVAWVRDHDTTGQWGSSLAWIKGRYDLP
jgi:hypothetical protein